QSGGECDGDVCGAGQWSQRDVRRQQYGDGGDGCLWYCNIASTGGEWLDRQLHGDRGGGGSDTGHVHVDQYGAAATVDYDGVGNGTEHGGEYGIRQRVAGARDGCVIEPGG